MGARPIGRAGRLRARPGRGRAPRRRDLGRRRPHRDCRRGRPRRTPVRLHRRRTQPPEIDHPPSRGTCGAARERGTSGLGRARARRRRHHPPQRPGRAPPRGRADPGPASRSPGQGWPPDPHRRAVAPRRAPRPRRSGPRGSDHRAPNRRDAVGVPDLVVALGTARRRTVGRPAAAGPDRYRHQAAPSRPRPTTAARPSRCPTRPATKPCSAPTSSSTSRAPGSASSCKRPGTTPSTDCTAPSPTRGGSTNDATSDASAPSVSRCCLATGSPEVWRSGAPSER